MQTVVMWLPRAASASWAEAVCRGQQIELTMRIDVKLTV